MQLRRAIVGCVAVGLALGVHITGVLAGAEDATVDQRFQLRPASPPSAVVLVALDERSLDLLGERPPIPRSRHAAMLDRLQSFHPLVIAYDVQFTEPTVESEDDALYDAVAGAAPVVLGTADVELDGDTRILGSTQNVKDAGGSVGVTLFPRARGGVYRRVEPRVHGVESLAFAAARAAGRARTDVGRRGLLIDYAGPPGTVRTLSFADVLEGRVAASVFRGKAVVVGVTAASQGDQHRVPTADYDLMAGSEIQANALSTVLRGEPLRAAPGCLGLLLVGLLAALGAQIAGRLSPAWLVAVVVGTLVGLAIGSYAAFLAGIVVELAGPAVALVVGAIVGALARQLRARRRARELRDVLTKLAGGRDVDELVGRVNDDELIVLSPGAHFGDYEIDRALGVGAMSVVHLARHRTTGRLVALKVMSAHLGDRPEMRDRFVREAEATGTVDHAAAVPIIEAGEIGGRPFLAMKLVEGGTLADLVRAGSLRPEDTVALLRPIAEALDHAHGRGVIHRDVKPSNILVDGDGRAYLADFGIAHLLDAARLTVEFVGTPSYTAPEQVRGAELTGACDQYALGCVLFECLTGRLPFASSAVIALMQAHLAEQPPAPSALASDLGPAIDAVLLRALAKDPAKRYASCVEMIDAAAGALGAGPSPAADPGGGGGGGATISATLHTRG